MAFQQLETHQNKQDRNPEQALIQNGAVMHAVKPRADGLGLCYRAMSEQVSEALDRDKADHAQSGRAGHKPDEGQRRGDEFGQRASHGNRAVKDRQLRGVIADRLEGFWEYLDIGACGGLKNTKQAGANLGQCRTPEIDQKHRAKHETCQCRQ